MAAIKALRIVTVLLIGFNSSAFQVVFPCRNSGFGRMTATTTTTTTSLYESTESDLDHSSENEVPSMDWLTNSLNRDEEDEDKQRFDMTSKAYIEEHEANDDLGDVPIPTTGVSVSDEMQKSHQDRFFAEIVPIKGLERGVRAAQIVTTSSMDSFEPVRYLVGLSKADGSTEIDDDQFVMIDVPPFSEKLKDEIENYIGPKGKLAAMIVTSRDCIHYEEAQGVFAIRRADLLKWETAFPDTARVAYRLDIPRDCRESITQRLDGYGPFALDDSQNNITTAFIETGRPLTYEQWDYDLSQDVLAGKTSPPDDAETESENCEDDEYSPEAIRAREEGKRVLAIYTPGRSFGSMSYVFPEVSLCASGFLLPVEESRNEENMGLDAAGPALDCRGYITTNRAGTTRQMESARTLVNGYVDRFNVILPSRGDPYFLDGDTQERKEELMEILDQYERIGQIYEQLGIMNEDDLA